MVPARLHPCFASDTDSCERENKNEKNVIKIPNYEHCFQHNLIVINSLLQQRGFDSFICITVLLCPFKCDRNIVIFKNVALE